MPRPASSRSANAILILAITLGGCHKQPPIVSVPSLLRTHIDLEPLTSRVRSNPEQACQAPSCLWIPSRVAVRPEKPNPAGGFTPAL